MDATNACCFAFDERPHPNSFEDSAAAVRQGRRAVIKTGLAARSERVRLQQGDFQFETGESQRKARSYQSTTGNGDVDFHWLFTRANIGTSMERDSCMHQALNVI